VSAGAARSACGLQEGLGLGTHLFVKVPPLEGSGNSVKYLTQGRNKQTCRPISTIALLNAERQAGKL